MAEFSDSLIDLYARCEPDKVQVDGTFKKLVDKHGENPFFNQERVRIEDLRRRMDKRTGIVKTAKAQIGEALRLYKQFVKGKDTVMAERCRKLAKLLYAKRWSKDQLKYFEDGCQSLREQREDYFLSFTDNPNPENDYRINRNHKFLIKHLLGHQAYKDADKRRENLLARAIHLYLRNERQMKGFYYKDEDRLGDGAEVEEKLRQGCRKALVFVQLVQNDMFVKVDGNWAHFEYSEALAAGRDPGRSSFLLAEGSQDKLIKGHEVPIQFSDWYEDVVKRDKIALEFTDEYSTKKIKAERRKLSQLLADRIEEAKEALFESAPD